MATTGVEPTTLDLELLDKLQNPLDSMGLEPAPAASVLESSASKEATKEAILRTANGEQTFRLANSKRNADVHALFPSILPTDRLVDDYTCAWLKDILIHGRLYILEHCIAFHAKIIWTYQLVVPYEDITSVEKKTVAGFIQNAIEISTLENKARSLISISSAVSTRERLHTT
jgi:hypothetical protein